MLLNSDITYCLDFALSEATSGERFGKRGNKEFSSSVEQLIF